MLHESSQEISNKLTNIVGQENVSRTIGPPEPCRIVHSNYDEKVVPMAVVWPQNGKQVAEIVAFANREGIPLVTWGAGTDRYSGGIGPLQRSIVLTTQRMNKVLNVDREYNTVTVEAGVTVEQLNQELIPFGLWWPHDPESRQYATVGGTVSVNGIGAFGTKYGTAPETVLGLTVVIPSGQMLKFGCKVKDSLVGYDMVGLFTRAEGTLGVIVDVTLRVVRRPETRNYRISLFDDMNDACKSCAELLSSGLIPEVLLIEDPNRFRNTITDLRHDLASEIRTMTEKKKALVIISFSGSQEVVESDISQSEKIISGTSGKFIQDDGIVETWWEAKTRHAPQIPIDSRTKIAAKIGISDLSVPLSAVPTIFDKFAETVSKYDLVPEGGRCYIKLNGDALISLVVVFDDSSQDEVSKFRAWLSEISRAAVDLGGTMSSLTGTGQKLVNEVSYELQKSEEIVKVLKKSLDPTNIMNPGKKLPIRI
jgi:glycolate oxidase